MITGQYNDGIILSHVGARVMQNRRVHCLDAFFDRVNIERRMPTDHLLLVSMVQLHVLLMQSDFVAENHAHI